MKTKLFKIKLIKEQINKRGFVIPFSLLISTIILSISLGVSLILVKEIFFSKLNSDSLLAYYAADEALDCAIYLNNKYVTTGSGNSYGLFPHTNESEISNTLGLPIYGLSKDNIVCNTSHIFTSPNYKGVDSVNCSNNICETKYDMKMDLGDGSFRCASVKVTANPDVNDPTIFNYSYVATGYSSCDSRNRIERSLFK